MVTGNDREILRQILELTDTACQAALELLELYACGEPGAALALLSDLRGVVQAAGAAQEPLAPALEHAYTSEMLENIADTLEEIERSMQGDDPERAAMKMEFQLFPFLRLLKEAFYFWGAVCPDRSEMARYYREEFAAHYRNLYVQEEPSPLRLSIVVTGYNHLEMTKKCVEQLLKETDFEKLQAELILIDHGSTDGTLEYFESLGVGKVIHFKKNVRMYMFCALSQLCQGEYFCFVSNDVLVTRGWADILLNCLESDPKIIAAVPATPNIANLQMPNVPTNDPEGFIAWANAQNRADPSRWSDRARLMPPLGMYRTRAVSELGFADPYFYSMEFWDDDFSLRARRAGYRQIVCGDVACYHFGSVTGKEGQIKEGTLVYGRELFQKKHGVDAWGNGFCYDLYGVRQYRFAPADRGPANILGLDCGFGDTAMQILDLLRREGREGYIYHVTTDARYLPDQEPHAAEAVCTPVEGLLPTLADRFAGVRFAALFLGQSLERYPEPYRLLEALSRRTAPGGQLVFFFSNPYFALRLHQMLQCSIPDSPLRLLHPEQVGEEAGRYFSHVALTGVTQPVQGLEAFIVRHYGREFLKNAQSSRLEISRYYVRCVK